MAVNFLSRFKFFTNMGARGKVGLLVAGLAAIILVMYLVVRFLAGEETGTGASSITGVPADIASVPGGQLTPEYYRALQQANTQAAQQAKISGGSAIPTLIKTNPGAPELNQQGSNGCTIICSEDQVNIKSTLDEWVSTGQLSPDVSSALQQLADKNPSVDEFSTELDNLVKSGKLTPEQARRLLEQYKKQRANAQLTESAKIMDGMIKDGSLPLNVANDLLMAQKNKISPAEYTATLDKMVRSGKISAPTAKALSDQYIQQRAKETVAKRVAMLKAMVAKGELTPEVANALIEKEQQMVPANDYESTLNGFVTQGKLIPLTANKLLDGYKEDKATVGSAGLIYKMSKDAEAAAYTDIDDLAKAGSLPPDAVQKLTNQIRSDASAEEYEAAVQQLVAEKKISPEVATRLTTNYGVLKGLRKEAAAQANLKSMVSSGAVPADVAEKLASQMGQKVPVESYEAAVNQQVAEKKIAPEVAARLVADYKAAKAAGAEPAAYSDIKALASSGALPPDAAAQLLDQASKDVSAESYQNAVQQLVTDKKITPEVANRLVGNYRVLKGLRQKAAEYGDLQDLTSSGALPPAAAQQLTSLINQDVPLENYQKMVQQLVAEKKITPAVAARLNSNYRVVKGLRKMAPILTAMQDNDASVSDYTEELKRAVSVGELTPTQATELLQEYEGLKSARAAATAPGVTASTPGDATSNFAVLQQRIAAANAASQAQAAPDFQAPPPEAAPGTPGLTEQQLAQQQQLEQQLAQQQAQALQNMVSAMAGQAGQLINSWQPVKMESKVGIEPKENKSTTGSAGSGGSGSGTGGVTGTALSSQILLKAGTILFAVLDTAVNSDYPDSPVMATVVDGKYKGAKLMGRLTVTKSVSGQMDRVMLNFTLMNKDDWEKSLPVNAFAIDPDTARTVLASNVDYHYLKRFGAMMATSFLQGYGQAINNAGTSTTGIFGTSTTTPELSPSQKIFSALGQMGKTLGGVTQNYVNTPPTVKVNAGVGLGILFMADISNSSDLESAPVPVATVPTVTSIIPASAIPTIPSPPTQTVVVTQPST